MDGFTLHPAVTAGAVAPNQSRCPALTTGCTSPLSRACRLYDHRGIPLPVVRRLARQVLVALDYLHTQCHIIHTGARWLLTCWLFAWIMPGCAARGARGLAFDGVRQASCSAAAAAASRRCCPSAGCHTNQSPQPPAIPRLQT